MLQLFKKKTPISYYGGKQQMANKIAKAIPEHQLYCEPFFGGWAVFFAKDPSSIEVIGDINEVVANFYQMAKDPELFPFLQKMVEATPYARCEWAAARTVWRNPDCFSDLKKAWAFWVLSAMCFSSNIGSGFAYDRSNNTVAKRFLNKKKAFGARISERLANTCIENINALDLIAARDNENAFFYIDPPYVSEYKGSKKGKNKVDQGHYSGYTVQDYDDLLTLLWTIKGKFILSNYPSDLLDKHIQANGWKMRSETKALQAGSKANGKVSGTKTEVLVANFDLVIES